MTQNVHSRRARTLVEVIVNIAIISAIVTVLLPARAGAQVTTATLYGVVRDSTGAVLPGATVNVSNPATNLSRATVTDDRGEFAMPALPIGQYTLQIELSGFRTYTNTGLQFGAGQVVRQTFQLEVGQLSDAVTVVESAPLVEAGSAAQIESLRSREVQQLPVPRRNLQNLVGLSPGVSLGDSSNPTGRSFRVNGVGDGGTAITVDGSNATANGENHGFGQYGGTNQIELMSLEAVAEIQVVKGVMPAEYGGAAGGQVNLITRSGTNVFHGSLLENYQNESFFARDRFLPATTAKPDVKFNQFGGSLGGPIVRNRAMFFVAYEGYRDETGVTVQGSVPTQQTRDRVLAALPFPETKIALDGLPLPNQPINADVGRFVTAKQQTRRDNHVLGKGDVTIFGGNLSVTASRLRPNAVNPSFAVANDERLENASDRLTTQFVRAGTWVSETRFGWNHNTLHRFTDFWNVTDPSRPGTPAFADVDTRLGEFAIGGLFGTPRAEALEMDNQSFNLDQKLSRVLGAHTVKAGGRWYREEGYKTNPQITRYAYQTLDDLLNSRANSVLVAPGQPPHEASKSEWGLFIQDDWRVNDKLMLNLGLRYDYYSKVRVRATSDIGAEIVNLERASDLRLMDFGAERPQDDLYDADPWNFGPRAGFAWKLDEAGRTIVRGGAGILYSGQLLAVFQNMVSDPYVPGRVSWNLTQVAAKGLKWPMYADALRDIAVQDANGKKSLYGIIDTKIQNPYTVQSMIDVQRALGGSWMVNGSYLHTAGRDFPMSRNFALSFDRATGARINPALGSPSGWYLDSSQSMNYDAFEANVKGRMGTNLELAAHYTLAKGSAQQGGDLTGNFGSGVQTFLATQDFYDPDFDIGPLSQDVRHRVTAQAVYELPWFKNGSDLLSQIAGGWQVASIVNIRSGLPLRLSQPSGIGNSRPDYIGGDPVLPNWQDTLLYLNPAAFAPVPTYAATNATIRPGTQNPSQVRGPGRWTVDLSLAKTVRLPGSMQLQFRAETFNVFNHVNYENPNTTINSPDFGKITSAAPARTGQIGLRFTF